jgi:hypothetical protein
MVVEGENKMKTIKLTEAQLNMLRLAWNEYGVGFWDEVEHGEDKRKIKTFEAIQKKLW